ncbi:uncharacterized protein LOC110678525 [Aedes aegypti]|uniref:Uncharacterized protein n=1 Tax=Aedes aegypti TaxID=7159 RepID=A0A6I8U0L4_AEDAE|nr:uncharacterized protein LOC110678506 [Aedes aegypti]XP_021707202.1 uncharacterized protein LOC110678525 [Aedes aegypti]
MLFGENCGLRLLECAEKMSQDNISVDTILKPSTIVDKPAASNDTSAGNWIPTLRLGIYSHLHDESCDDTGSLKEMKFGCNVTESNDDTSTEDIREDLPMDIILEDEEVQDILDTEDRNMSTDNLNYCANDEYEMHLNEDWLENILTDATSTDRDALILKYETELDQKNRQIEDSVKTIEDQKNF